MPLGMNLHVGKKFIRAGYNCTTEEELERREVQLYHQGRTGEKADPTVVIGRN